MKTCAALLVLVAAVLALGFTTAVAQDAPIDGAKWYAEGNAFLKKGDLENALTAFGQAAGAPDAKPEYKRKFLQTRAVIKMREVIATEQDEAKWFKTATRLRNFYYSFRLHADLHALAAEMHKRRPTIGTASLLADACLMLGKNEEAEETLASCEAEKLNLQAKVLLAVARARQGKMDPAKAVLAELKIPATVSPRFLFDVARLEVLCGQVDEGMKTLTIALQKTNTKGLASFKGYVKDAPDFGKVPAETLAKVLATDSKVDGSSCSGGSSCGSCPKKGTCGSAKKQ